MGDEREIRGSVASLRLDAVASLGFGISRTKAVDSIKAGRVELNGRLILSPGRAVKAGDIILWRGKGRISIETVLGETKRGRVNLLVRRYIERQERSAPGVEL